MSNESLSRPECQWWPTSAQSHWDEDLQPPTASGRLGDVHQVRIDRAVGIWGHDSERIKARIGMKRVLSDGIYRFPRSHQGVAFSQ